MIVNREIKFRTWDTKFKEFSEWTNRDPFFSTSEGKIFFWERTRNEDGSYGGDIILQDLGDRFILQQYTGLKDKDGREIYESDIIRETIPTQDVFTGVVSFFAGMFLIDYKDQTDSGPIGFLTTSTLEVIGNIYKTPELL